MQLLAIGQKGLARIAGHLHHPVPQQHGTAGQRAHRLLIVRHEQQGGAVTGEPFHALETALLEQRVAHRQRLVDDQNIGLNAHLDGERQTHQHAAGIRLDRLIDELADVGEGGDVVEARADLIVRQAQHRAVHDHVFAPGEVGREAGAELKQRGDPAAGLHRAGGRAKGAADHLQQRRFAAAVATDDADRFAFFDLERDILQGPEFVEILALRAPGHALQTGQHKLLQAVARGIVDFIPFAQVTDPDRHFIRGHRQNLYAFSGTRQNRPRRPARPLINRCRGRASSATRPRSRRREPAR
jgi:hypothetical protein